MKANSQEALVYVAMSILCSRSNSLIPELFYFMKAEQLINMIKIYGGETIRIPTIEEFRRDLISAVAGYYTVVEGYDWDYIRIKFDVDGNELRSIKNRLEKWMETASPEEIEFLKSIKRVDPDE